MMIITIICVEEMKHSYNPEMKEGLFLTLQLIFLHGEYFTNAPN